MRKTVVAILLLLAASGCRKKTTLSSNLEVENKVAMRSVNLYYEAPDMLLASERRDIALPENPAGAIPVVVRELLKGPANTAVPRLLPADAVLRGAYLLPDGTALVDLGGPTLTGGWPVGSHQELMALYSVVQTVTANFAEVKRVHVLVNGSPADTLGGHITLARALVPVPGLVRR